MSKETIEPGQDASLTYQPIWQEKPFVIHSDYEDVLNVREAVEATRKAESSKLPRLAGKAVIQAENAPEVLSGRKATLHAKLYDMAHKTDMYGLLQERRNQERDLTMAKRLGLITTDRCAKHEKALATVRGL